MQDKLDQALALAKIAADASARAIRTNVAVFKAQAEGFEFLFADLGQIVLKAPDDFLSTVLSRISVHKLSEQPRQAKETAAQAIEAAKNTEAPNSQQVLKAGPATADATAREASAGASPSGGSMGAGQAAAAAAAVDEPATIKLGDICARLGFTMTAAFVGGTLGVQPAKSDGRAMLYRESDFTAICDRLQDLINRVHFVHRGFGSSPRAKAEPAILPA
jgi:hypothetical protein